MQFCSYIDSDKEPRVAAMLLRHGADVNNLNKLDRGALDVAISNGNQNVLHKNNMQRNFKAS